MRRILVANRGEVAVRIIRACRELGIETIAIYSEADRSALHVIWADQAVCVGPPPSQQSYLNMQNILAAALAHGAEGIHPGYGYLSENALFAEMCAAHGLVFIGPEARHLELLGDKAQAKAVLREAGVPVIPGSGVIRDHRELSEAADELGYPLVIKSCAGGGGRGMRLVKEPGELLSSFAAARAEALAFFGCDRCYLEKWLTPVRHIEIQLLADHYGRVVHVGERECSLQRRQQKLLEECPSPVVDAGLRARLGAAAVRAAKAVNYRNAGTVEFLVDAAGDYYFLEMNTRLQVEHPVTELVYGVDLVQEQIRLAAGEPLRYAQAELKPRGHAIQCRITAEAVRPGSHPFSGVVERLLVPGGFGVRWDSHLYQGYAISPFYDALLGKLIVWGQTREEAIRRLARALDELVVEGIETSIPFHRAVLRDQRFTSGCFSTDFVEQWLQESEIVG
ncbi:MAG TPA: acetyl-CoA carboxylase biotin carboxylase subunit [Limnochordia bacterium]|nr:acetyl-CoA carboxylase biotin carboxylase subunit [Limnochordia bacterium]